MGSLGRRCRWWAGWLRFQVRQFLKPTRVLIREEEERIARSTFMLGRGGLDPETGEALFKAREDYWYEGVKWPDQEERT